MQVLEGSVFHLGEAPRGVSWYEDREGKYLRYLEDSNNLQKL